MLVDAAYPMVQIFEFGDHDYLVYDAKAHFAFIAARESKIIDYERFGIQASNQDAIIQLIRGMQEIKVNNCADKKMSAWQAIQYKLLSIGQRSQRLGIYQDAGSTLINQLTDISIIFVAAVAVINQEISLGMMLAVQSIVGQLSGPARQLAGFIYTLQSINTALERIADVYMMEDEADSQLALEPVMAGVNDIVFDNVIFQYGSSSSPKVIDGLSLRIPRGKTTAIVGSNGSGKTTLLKLLLGFYHPTQGSIVVNETPLHTLNLDAGRESCGTVMQDGDICYDSIADNT
jgi:ATP-binding cassette subfamily B protein